MDIVHALALVAVFVTGAVGAIKKAFPGWMNGKEELLSLVFPIIIFPVLKTAHVIDATWATVVILILGGALGAGILHDKVVNPLMARKRQPGDDGIEMFALHGRDLTDVDPLPPFVRQAPLVRQDPPK
jgi:hypothetical protein